MAKTVEEQLEEYRELQERIEELYERVKERNRLDDNYVDSNGSSNLNH